MEVLGHEPSTLYVTAHWVVDGRRKTDGACSADCGKAGIPVTVPDTSRAFHTYGVSWRPDAIRWYFDGVEVFSAPTPAGMHQPMYILANLAVGKPGSWPGPADGSASATMLIDYIRAYQFDDLAGSRMPARR
jgi:beta-glucanase (GH16 family)